MTYKLVFKVKKLYLFSAKHFGKVKNNAPGVDLTSPRVNGDF